MGIDVAALLERIGGRPAVALRLLDLFAAQLEKDLRALRGELEAGRSREVAGVAHGLAGAAACVGADRARELASRIEATSREGRLTDGFPLLAALEAEGEQILADLPELVRQLSGSTLA